MATELSKAISLAQWLADREQAGVIVVRVGPNRYVTVNAYFCHFFDHSDHYQVVHRCEPTPREETSP